MQYSYLVDSHCHLNYPDFKDDFSSILNRAQEKNVRLMLSISTDFSEFPDILKIAETHPQIYCTIGAHPHEAASHDHITLQDFLIHTNHPKVVGLGETGLDYYYETSSRESQKKSFKLHISTHKETKLPLIIHSRDGEEDLLQILEDENVRSIDGYSPGVIHCFTGTQGFADACLKRDFYISISGIVTFKNSDHLRTIVQNLPLDRILVETDAPFLAPVPFRGKRNEPSFVAETAKFLADLKGVSLDELMRQTTENFHKVFWKTQKL